MSYTQPNPYGLLGKKIGANMNSTADQLINITGPTTKKFIVRKIIVNNASTSLTTAAGGVYDAASKGGNAIVAATQVYTALTAAAKFLDLTLQAPATTDALAVNILYFALTTAQGAVATADIFIYGEFLA